MASPSRPPKELFPSRAYRWDLERLYSDLARVKHHQLSPTERLCLRGLLCGLDPKALAAILCWQPQGLQVNLSQGLYQYLETLTNQTVNNWGEVAVILDHAGYRIPSYVAPSPAGQDEPARDYARFYFENSVRSLRGTLAHRLLMALALFPQPARMGVIAYVAASPDSRQTAAALEQLQHLLLVDCHGDRFSLLPLIQLDAIAELADQPSFERDARNRWVNWYLSFVQEYGGHSLGIDEGDSIVWSALPSCPNSDEADADRVLKEEWKNLEAVLEWCMAHHRYNDVQRFWRQMQGYTYPWNNAIHQLAFWTARVEWGTWLIEASERYQDWEIVLEVMADQGWMLTLSGQPEHLKQAEGLYTKAWGLRHYKDEQFQVELAIHIAILRLQQNQVELAARWLHQANRLLDAADIEDLAATRSLVCLLYYHGEIAYQTGDYFQAKTLFQQTLAQAELLDWQRVVWLAKDWLARVSIQQKDFEDAQRLIEEGLSLAILTHDSCRMAICKRSLAGLEKERGNLQFACRWAMEARQIFKQLGMGSEVRAIDRFLQELEP